MTAGDIKRLDHHDTPIWRIAQLCGVGAILIGSSGLLGWMLDIPALNRIIPGYKPIAVSMSMIAILLGGVQILLARRLSRWAAAVLLVVPLFIAVFGLLEIILLVTGINLTIEDAMLRQYPALDAHPDARISPVAGILSFLIASLQSLLLYGRAAGKLSRSLTDFIGGAGTLIILTSALFFLSYLFRTPLLYGTVYIPIAFTATIAALLLGIGLVATVGNASVPLQWFAGTSTRARLLRAFLPLTALVMLLLSLAQFLTTRFTLLNPAIAASILIILFEVVITSAILQVARVIGNQIDRAEEERESSLQQLAEERSRLRTVLETLPVGVLILDDRDRIVETNTSAQRIFAGSAALTHLTQEYRKGKAWWTATGQPVQEDEWPSVQALRRGTVVPGQEIDILCADGTRATVLDTAAPLNDQQGKTIGAVAVVQDITDRKRAEEELRQFAETLDQRVRERTEQLSDALEREQTIRIEAESARSYFQGILEAAPDSIVIVDADGRISLINSQTEQLSGYTREELIGRHVEVLIPERYGTVHVQHRAEYMAAPRTRPMGVGLDLYLRRKDGQEVPVEISLSPFQTPDGMLVTASVRDISARKQAEAEINRLNEELQRNVEQLKETNKELEAFSYSVSHDLRAPLRGIDGFSKVLLEQYADRVDERGRDYLTRVRNAAKRMGRLIDDMLNLSRIGRREMVRRTVNLSELAASIIEDLRQREPERQIEVAIAPDLQVTGDSDLLRIVLDNLLGNAWKFTSHREEARIELGMTTRDGERIYFVRDNGAGFDMAYAGKLFTPFQRLHAETEFPGTGIGLAIVQRIIARHGGRVWAEGEEGKGATIFFTLGEAA
ncbi:MAG: PAS domain S-box protein [Armatimonadota bacterium]